MVNFLFPFIVFIAHSTIASMSSLFADASNARLAYVLASLRVWIKCSCDFKRFSAMCRCKNLKRYAWKNLRSKS